MTKLVRMEFGANTPPEARRVFVTSRPDVDGDPPGGSSALATLVAAATVVATPKESDTDCWCTPEWLCAFLPVVDLDPCANAASHVPARTEYNLVERGEDGLALPWFGNVFVNPPYSSPLKWCERAHEHVARPHPADPLDLPSAERAVLLLVNYDPTTKWYRALRGRGVRSRTYVFAKRLTFEPGAGVVVPPSGVSCNTRVSCLVELSRPFGGPSVFTDTIGKLGARRLIRRVA